MSIVNLYHNQMKWAINPTLRYATSSLLQDLAMSEMDVVIVIDGYEGTGKSFMARALGRYFATILRKWFPETTFGPEDITFDTSDYVNQSLAFGQLDENSKKVKINVLDEGRNALNKMRRNSKSNVVFTNYLSECRAMRQVHIILAPAFHDLDKYLVFWRTHMIIHSVKNYGERTKTDKPGIVDVVLRRGEYRLYTTKNFIRVCYNMPYQYPNKYDCRDRFCPKEVFNEGELKAYDDKKYAATMKKYFEEAEKAEEKT